ncbi:MAG: 50S ribosomal protein L29 [candidate division Zixibacteria bacterium]
MKAREIRDMTREEILSHKEEIEKEVFNLKIRQATKQIDNPLKIRTLRRELSRIVTVLHEDELKIRPLAAKGDTKNV